MPLENLDPVISINKQKRAFSEEQNALRSEAASIVAEMIDPATAQTATPEQLIAETDRVANLLRQERASSLTRDPSGAVSPRDLVPGALFRKGTSAALDLLPPGARPTSTARGLGFGAAIDAFGPGEVQLDELGNLVQAVGTGVAGAIPQVRAAKLARGAGSLIKPAIQSTLASSAAAGGIGAAIQQQLDNAQRLIDQADAMGQAPISKMNAIREAAFDTTMEERIFRGLGEATIEGVGAGIFAFGPAIAKGGFAKAAGLDSAEADAMIDLAKNNQIQIGLQDVSPVGLIQRAGMVFGKFPLVAAQFVKSREKQAGQISARLRSSIGDMAPVVSVLKEMIESGNAKDNVQRILEANVRGANKISGFFREFKNRVDPMYESFRQAAKAEGATVGNANTVLYAAIERAKIRDLPRVVDAKGVAKTPPPTGIMARVDEELTKIIKMEPNPSLQAFINRGQELESLIQEFPIGSLAAKRLIIIKNAMEADMNTNLNASEAVRGLKAAADAEFKAGMEILGGAAARRFKRVDRSFGQVRLKELDPNQLGELGLPRGGSVSPTQMIDHMLKSEDVEVVHNLKSLLTKGNPVEGQKAFNEVVALHLDRVISESIDREVRGADFPVTNTRALRTALGLGNKTGKRYVANSEMFRLAGGDLEKFDEVLGLADRFFADGVPDVSTFIARRAVLGGLGSAFRSLAPLSSKKGLADSGAKGFVQNVASAAAVYLMMRGTAKRLTDPGYLKAYRVLLDPAKSTRSRMLAIRRLVAMDVTFLAFDELTGGRVTETQRSLAQGGSDILNVAREGARSVKGRLSGGRVINNLPPLQER